MADDRHHHHNRAGVSKFSSPLGRRISSQQKISSDHEILQSPSIPHLLQPSAPTSSPVLINVSVALMGPAVINQENRNVRSSFNFDLNLPPPLEEEEEAGCSNQLSPAVNAAGEGKERQENENGRVSEVGPKEGKDGTHLGGSNSKSPIENGGGRGRGGRIQEKENGIRSKRLYMLAEVARKERKMLLKKEKLLATNGIHDELPRNQEEARAGRNAAGEVEEPPLMAAEVVEDNFSEAEAGETRRRSRRVRKRPSRYLDSVVYHSKSA